MKLERNASVCMKALPFWMVPYTFYMYYLSLFLIEKGLTEAQVTQLMTISNAVCLVCSFFASPIVDRLGRKNTLTIFDIVSSVLPPLILLMSQNFVSVAIALSLSGANRIMSTAYYLVMVEDTSDENSINAMNVFNIISVVAGIMTPLAGIIVGRLGIISGERLFLIVSVVLMTSQDIIRHFFIKETETGRKVKEAGRSKERKNMLQTYGRTLSFIGKNRNVLSAVIINGIIYVYYNIGTTTSLLFTPYFANYRNLSGVVLASVGAIYSAGTLFSMILINPRINQSNIYAFTTVSALVSVLGFVLMLVCPVGNMWLLFTSIALLALSYGVLKSVADGLLAMENQGEYSSGVYSVSFIVSSVLSILALKLVEVLYQRSPNWLFGLSLILICVILADCFVYRRKRNV